MSSPDRRRYPRRPVSLLASVVPLIGRSLGDVLEVEICDLSAKGIGLLSAYPLLQGDFFLIAARVADATPRTMTFKVVRSYCAKDGRYRIGSQFVCVVEDLPQLPPVDLDATLGPLVD